MMGGVKVETEVIWVKKCLMNLTLKAYIHNYKAKLNLKINSETPRMKPMNLCIELMASPYKKELIN